MAELAIRPAPRSGADSRADLRFNLKAKQAADILAVNVFERARKGQAQVGARPVTQAAPTQPALTAEQRMRQALKEKIDVLSQKAKARPAMTTVASAPANMPGSAVQRQSLTERLKALSRKAPDQPGPDYDSGEQTIGYASVAGQAAPVELSAISGTLSALKEYNGWAIASLWTSERFERRVKGQALSGLTEGLEYTLRGTPSDHAVHGPSFEVVSVEPAISPNDQAIEIFLVRSFSGIGSAKAAKYLKSVRADGGDGAVEALRIKLLNEPWTVDLTKIAKGATFKKGEDPHGTTRLVVVARNLMLKLGSKGGLRESTAKALAAFLVSKVVTPEKTEALKTLTPAQRTQAEADTTANVASATWAVLMLDPYAPIGKTPSYGFATAELVAQVAGIPKDSPLRLGRLVEHAVENGCQRRGHCYLSKDEFVESIRRVDPTAPAQKALVAAISQKLVAIEDGRVYPSTLLVAEKDVAVELALLMRPAKPLTERSVADVLKKLSVAPERINPAFKKGFDRHQLDAISTIMTSPQRLHVLTGGPGTGKTAIMEVMLSLLKQKRFMFAGPTGKSAKVLTARVEQFGYSATTLHSLLRGSEESGFEQNEANPLECDVLVVDENTMNGIGMASAILSALPEHAHVIFLGDPGIERIDSKPELIPCAGQLPSISPGRFMQDLLKIPGVQHVHLTKTYRNSGGILDVVKEIASYSVSTTSRASVNFSHGLPKAEEGFSTVMDEYFDRVKQDGFENAFLVMPLRKGERETPGWNTTYANHVLRQACNPDGIKLPGTTLYIGDRVMVRANQDIPQPDVNDMGVRVGADPLPTTALAAADSSRKSAAGTGRVVNGDTGTILGYSLSKTDKNVASAQWVSLKLDDGRTIEYPGHEVASLDHAYAGTVHSTQGSEYKHVIMVATPGNAEFMNANMLLTAASRPKESLKIWGDDSIIKKIAATPMPKRNSGLVERVIEEMAALEQDDDPEKAESLVGADTPDF